MSNLGNKSVFAKNLKHYLKLHQKDRKQICKELDIKYSTFSEWCNAKKYPRIDKIEMLANYFGILKSDLIEEHATDGRAGAEPEPLSVTDKYEKSLINNYRKLSDQGKEYILQTMEMAVKTYKKDSGATDTKIS